MQFKRWPSWPRLTLAMLALCAVPAWLAAQQPTQVEPAQKLEQVKQTFESKQTELRQMFSEEKDESARAKLYEDFKVFVRQSLKEARAVAESAEGTETAAQAWAFVLSNAPEINNMELAGKAFDTLLAKHISSPVWVELAPNIGDLPRMGMNEEKVEKSMRTLMEKSPHKGVQAAAMFSLGVYLGEKEEPARHAEGMALIARVKKDFAEIKEAKEYVARAEGTLFQLEKLQPGMPCPDFEASDENGVKFKLSDYKGKVVLVDFWGYW